MAVSHVRGFLIDASIVSLEALLNGVDVVLVIVSKVYQSLATVSTSITRPPNNNNNNNTTNNKPRVVIIGASFAGLATEHGLNKDLLDVTVIDFKEYFEYVPGSLRCLVEPHHFSKALSCDLKRQRTTEKSTTVVKGLVTKVLKQSVQLDNGQSTPYDYLVLAAGSTYMSPIKPTTQQVTLRQRQDAWNEAAHTLKEASTVLIVGAGAVGVELAGEILTHYPNGQKRVVLVDVAPQILTGFPLQSAKYATQWLLRHGGELRLGERLQELTDTTATLSTGERLQCDVIYKCVGAAPNTEFLQNGILNDSLRGPKNAVLVNDHLQVQDFETIFCAGDLCYHPLSNEIKLGHTAEVNAHLVAKNVHRLVCGASLLRYPDGVVGNVVTPKIYDISLGKYDGTLGFNSLVINGSLSAIVKWLLEWTKVAAAANRPVGVLFWQLADFVSNLLGRTILPTPLPNNTVVSKKQN